MRSETRDMSRGKINGYCVDCHGAEAIKAVGAYEGVFDAGKKKPVCTDCHGQHCLKVRTRIWNKDTGEQVSDDGVRMMYENSPTNLRP